MELGPVGEARIARERDHLAALHRLAALDEQLAGMAVDGGPAAAMAQDDEPAEGGDVAADIGDDAVGRGEDRRVERDGDLDPVVALAAGAGAEALDDLARTGQWNWPGEPAGAATAAVAGSTRAEEAVGRAGCAVAASAGWPPVTMSSMSRRKARGALLDRLGAAASGISTRWPARRI